MKAPNHGRRVRVYGKRLLDQWVGYPIYLPTLGGRAIRGHLRDAEECQIVCVFSDDTVRIA